MITLWKYESAPENLRDLSRGQNPQTWVVWAPASLSALVEAFLELNGAAHRDRYEMPDATVVFFCPDSNRSEV